MCRAFVYFVLTTGSVARRAIAMSGATDHDGGVAGEALAGALAATYPCETHEQGTYTWANPAHPLAIFPTNPDSWCNHQHHPESQQTKWFFLPCPSQQVAELFTSPATQNRLFHFMGSYLAVYSFAAVAAAAAGGVQPTTDDIRKALHAMLPPDWGTWTARTVSTPASCAATAAHADLAGPAAPAGPDGTREGGGDHQPPNTPTVKPPNGPMDKAPLHTQWALKVTLHGKWKYLSPMLTPLCDDSSATNQLFGHALRDAAAFADATAPDVLTAATAAVAQMLQE